MTDQLTKRLAEAIRAFFVEAGRAPANYVEDEVDGAVEEMLAALRAYDEALKGRYAPGSDNA
jgi:hypothetical protein